MKTYSKLLLMGANSSGKGVVNSPTRETAIPAVSAPVDRGEKDGVVNLTVDSTDHRGLKDLWPVGGGGASLRCPKRGTGGGEIRSVAKLTKTHNETLQNNTKHHQPPRNQRARNRTHRAGKR